MPIDETVARRMGDYTSVLGPPRRSNGARRMSSLTDQRRIQHERDIEMTVVKAAAVQISPVLYSREGTVEKVVEKIIALGHQGVQFATFPEAIVPYYPYFSTSQRPIENRRPTTALARPGGDGSFGDDPCHRGCLRSSGNGRVHRSQRARRRDNLQHATAV